MEAAATTLNLDARLSKRDDEPLLRSAHCARRVPRIAIKAMFVTLTQLQKGEASVLQTVIDNTCGKLNVALRGFHYEVGYRNVSSSAGILWRPAVADNQSCDRPQKIPVPAGLYTIERLSHFLMEEIPGLTLKMNKTTGLIKLNIPESSGMIKLTGDLRRIMGIDERGWII